MNEYLAALKRGDYISVYNWRDVMETWWDNHVDTGFGVARHPDGNAVLVPNAQYLCLLTPKTELLNGYAVMPDGMFESLKSQGYEFTTGKINQYGNRLLSQEQALANTVLEALIPDKTLRDASIVNTFAQGKERFRYDEMIGVNFPDAQEKPVMGLVCVRALYYKSNAGCKGSSDDIFGHLIGVSPGVAEGDARKLEYIVQAK